MTGTMPKQLRTRELCAKGMELMELGNPGSGKKAQHFFENAIQAEPGYAGSHSGLSEAILLAESHAIYAGQKGHEKAYSRALEEAKKAVALDGNASLSYRALACALQRMGNYKEAREAGRRSIELDPADFKAQAILGDTFAYGSSPQSREQAEQAYFKAIELAPSDWYAYHRLAVSFQNRGALTEALERNEVAHGLQPGAVFPYITGGVCSAWLGDYEQARFFLEEGLKIAPDMTLIRAKLAVVAFHLKDFKALRFWLHGLDQAWSETHSMTVLLKGLSDLADGNASACVKRFTDYHIYSAGFDWDGISRWEKRSASVNLYHMGQLTAKLKNRPLAQRLVDEADRLHYGKRLIAAKDPVFSGMKF